MKQSYREELQMRQPQAVNDAFCGGAYGCPGEYFRGAPAQNCQNIARTQCERCWGGTYASEEWIPYEKRDE